MGTDTNENSVLVLDCPELAFDVGRLVRFLGKRILHLVIQLENVFVHLFGAANNPHRLTAPFDGHLLTWLQFTDIDGDRCTGCFRFGTGIPGCYERHGRTDDADTTHHRRGTDQKSAPALAHVAITHYGYLPSGDIQPCLQGNCTSKRTSLNLKL